MADLLPPLRHRWFFSYLRGSLRRRLAAVARKEPRPREVHVVLAVANHFEPGWRNATVATGLGRLRAWIDGVESASRVRDRYGSPLKHTYFFPAEQYEREYLETVEPHCRRGFGEIEVHLHHGVERPDTSDNLRQTLTGFAALLSKDHGWAVVDRTGRSPCYAFVHGNWALGNSAAGRFCGVDDELAILRETGCYLDMTMPSAPDATQVAVVNSMYTPVPPLDLPAPHRRGTPLETGRRVADPPFLLIQGPLLLDWTRRRRGLPFPRLENGDLGADNPPTIERFGLWRSANIHVLGRPGWVFVKLHCHGLQERHLATLAGPGMEAFTARLLQLAAACGFQLHFVSAREMANMALAAVEGADGDPHDVRDYNWTLE